MGETQAPTRHLVADAVVLAFSSSRTKSGIEPERLRTMTLVEFRGLVESGALDTGFLVELMAANPAFDRNSLPPALCLLKSWEERLGFQIQLPAALAAMSEIDRGARAAECIVAPADLKRLFESPAERAARIAAQEAAARRAREARAAISPDAIAARRSWRNRRDVGIAAGLVVALAGIFLALTLKGSFGGADWKAADTTDFAGAIPLIGAEQFGNQMGATLADPSWLAKSEAARRTDMSSALRSLQVRDVKVLFIKDDKGKVRATAQWFGSPPSIDVKFY
jgi:hypothetical protein